MKRPPGSAMMLRINPYSGTMPVTAGVAALTPRRTRALCVMNSGLMCSISWTSPAISATSSGRSRTGRPSPKPANGLVVRPPKRLTIRPPSPGKRFRVCRSRPTPNASSTTTATVPQAIPRTVREVRSFCARRSARKWRHTSGDLARRRLHQRIRHLQALLGLDIDRVHGSPEDQVPHGRHAHRHRASLVRRERHHWIADLDRVLEDVAVDGGADHRLHLLAAGQHLATLL